MKPFVYIASPYTKGDPAVNVHFQAKIFDELLSDGVVWPVSPLWTHLQHLILPRSYADWTGYDNATLLLYDACLRLNVTEPRMGDYLVTESSGADREEKIFKSQGKPVFYNKEDLYAWARAEGEKNFGRAFFRRNS